MYSTRVASRRNFEIFAGEPSIPSSPHSMTAYHPSMRDLEAISSRFSVLYSREIRGGLLNPMCRRLGRWTQPRRKLRSSTTFGKIDLQNSISRLGSRSSTYSLNFQLLLEGTISNRGESTRIWTKPRKRKAKIDTNAGLSRKKTEPRDRSSRR